MKSYLTSLVVLLSVCASAPAQAQTRSMRPYKALFGGATNDPSVRHSLDLSVSVAEGYDDNVLAQDGRPRLWCRHRFATEWSLHEYRPGAHIFLDWEDRAIQRVGVHEHSLLPERARVSRVDIVWSDWAVGRLRTDAFLVHPERQLFARVLLWVVSVVHAVRCRGHRDDGRRWERLCRQQRLGPGVRNVGEPDAQPDVALELQPVGDISVFGSVSGLSGARIFAPTVPAGDICTTCRATRRCILDISIGKVSTRTSPARSRPLRTISMSASTTTSRCRFHAARTSTSASVRRSSARRPLKQRARRFSTGSWEVPG